MDERDECKRTSDEVSKHLRQIGAGVVQAPLECFVQALDAFATAYL